MSPSGEALSEQQVGHEDDQQEGADADPLGRADVYVAPAAAEQQQDDQDDEDQVHPFSPSRATRSAQRRALETILRPPHRPIIARSSSRARLSRERTVPIGVPVAAAASTYDIPR